MGNPNLKGFLLIDGSMNTLLLPKEEFNTYDLDTVITHHIREAKPHKTKKDLYADISKYLKCEYEGGQGLHERW